MNWTTGSEQRQSTASFSKNIFPFCDKEFFPNGFSTLRISTIKAVQAERFPVLKTCKTSGSSSLRCSKQRKHAPPCAPLPPGKPPSFSGLRATRCRTRDLAGVTMRSQLCPEQGVKNARTKLLAFLLSISLVCYRSHQTESLDPPSQTLGQCLSAPFTVKELANTGPRRIINL